MGHNEAEYEEGKRAFRHGTARWENPYAEGSESALAWFAGYDSEAAEAYGRTP